MKSVKSKTDKEVVLNHPNINDVLIYDTETNSLDTSTAEVKFFGAYSYKYCKYFIFHKEEKQQIQKLIDDHKVLVGFNNRNFDRPIMENFINQFSLTYKICFDCMAVLYNFKKRRPNRETMIIVNGKSLQSSLPNHKLKTVCETLGFRFTKGDIEYSIFQKDSWTEEELKEIYLYLFKDVRLTRCLFEFYVEYFEPYKEYVNDDNIRKFDYIRSSGGSYAYSAICNLAGIKPEYEDDNLKKLQRPLNNGGFVLEPQVEYSALPTVYYDFSSLYPSLFIQCNLFSHSCNCCKQEEKWKGDGFFGVSGGYCSKTQGKIEKILLDIYKKRREYKKNGDPRQQALKLLLNTTYGIVSSPIFKNLYHKFTGGDCTTIGRRCIQYTAKKFEEEGFKVIYGDTDSVFVQIPKNKTIEDSKIVANKIVEDLQSHMPFPFPEELFELDIDDIFSKIWLFHKKFYIGINKDNKLIMKGIPIIKGNASQLGQLILERIKPLILEQQSIKFPKEYFKKIIDEEIEKDITVIGQVYNVRSPDKYKSASSIQCQIANKLGEGSHILIPNKSLGTIGRSKKYCTPEQAKTLSFSDLFLDKVYKELEPFIK